MRKLDLLFVAYMLAFSVAPLVPLRGWQGYGPAGEFSYTGPAVYIRYSDPTRGNDKPHLYCTDHGYKADIIEYSDQESSAAGLNLYRNFTVKTRLENGVLVARYTSPSLNLTKTVEPLPDGVEVVYKLSKPADTTITLWRWYYEQVEGYGLPTPRRLPDPARIAYTVVDGGRRYRVLVEVSPPPSLATVDSDGRGINKITVVLPAAKEVKIKTRCVGSEPLTPATPPSIAGSKILYPAVAAVLSAAYLALARRVEGG